MTKTYFRSFFVGERRGKFSILFNLNCNVFIRNLNLFFVFCFFVNFHDPRLFLLHFLLFFFSFHSLMFTPEFFTKFDALKNPKVFTLNRELKKVKKILKRLNKIPIRESLPLKKRQKLHKNL